MIRGNHRAADGQAARARAAARPRARGTRSADGETWLSHGGAELGSDARDRSRHRDVSSLWNVETDAALDPTDLPSGERVDSRHLIVRHVGELRARSRGPCASRSGFPRACGHRARAGCVCRVIATAESAKARDRYHVRHPASAPRSARRLSPGWMGRSGYLGIQPDPWGRVGAVALRQDYRANASASLALAASRGW